MRVLVVSSGDGFSGGWPAVAEATRRAGGGLMCVCDDFGVFRVSDLDKLDDPAYPACTIGQAA